MSKMVNFLSSLLTGLTERFEDIKFDYKLIPCQKCVTVCLSVCVGSREVGVLLVVGFCFSL